LLDAEVDGEPLLLTRREREIFNLLAQGLTGEQIASRLTLSPDTVRTHVRNGMEKLHEHTRTGAVVKALKADEIEG
jgi:DNA-binding NarL/FixJ family response regulator